MNAFYLAPKTKFITNCMILPLFLLAFVSTQATSSGLNPANGNFPPVNNILSACMPASLHPSASYLAVDKTVDDNSAFEPGQDFRFTIAIHNLSEMECEITAFDDTEYQGTPPVGKSIAPGGFYFVVYERTFTEAGIYHNVATVTARFSDGTTETVSDDATVEILDTYPDFVVSKFAMPHFRDEPGGEFFYSVAIRNYTQEPLIITGISDPYLPNLEDYIGTIIPGNGEFQIPQYSVSFTDAGEYRNTIRVYAGDNEGNNLYRESQSMVEVNDVHPQIQVTKTVEPVFMMEPGGYFNYSLKVKSNSPEPLSLRIHDDNLADEIIGSIQPDQTLEWNYTKQYTEPDNYNNIAMVWATDNEDNSELESASANVVVEDVEPSIEITLTALTEALCEPGGMFDFLVTIKNTSVEKVNVFGSCGTNYYVFNDMLPGASVTKMFQEEYTSPGSHICHVSLDVEDNDGNLIPYNEETIVWVLPKPELYNVHIMASEGSPGPPYDHPVDGTYNTRFLMCLNMDMEYYYLDIHDLSSSEPLKVMHANQFYLKGSYPPEFWEYWNSKGVNSTAAEPWQKRMWQILNGEKPMFVLIDMYGDYVLLDGLLLDMGHLAPLRISGDYPPGDYSFEGTITSNQDCVSDPIIVNLTLRRMPKILEQPRSLPTCVGEPAIFTVKATGTDLHYQWYKVGSPDIMLSGETDPSLTIDPVSEADANSYYVVVSGICAPPVKSETAILILKKVFVSHLSQQYSDPVTFRAEMLNGASLSAMYPKVRFLVGSQVMGVADMQVSGDDLVGILADVPLLEPPGPPNHQLEPGVKVVAAEFLDPDGNITGCVPKTNLIITRENATITYNEPEILATASVNESQVTVQLIAVVKDYDDGYPGNILNACVKFIIVQEPGGQEVASGYVPVNRLVLPGDCTTGLATYIFTADLAADDFKTYTIKMLAECYYTGTSSATLTVYKPVGDFITGGGHITTYDSYGTRAGEPGTPVNFGFHVKFNKKNTNLIGGINVIYRRMLGGIVNEFQLKSNSMSNLGVNIANPEAKKAVFITKANLTNLTTGVTVDGNLQLNVTLTDRGEPGANDAIGFTLWRISKGKPALLVYSSSWSGAKTNESILDGGNLVVHSGFSKSSEIAEPVMTLPDEKPVTEVTAFPNPFRDKFTIELVPEADGLIMLEVFDMMGRKLAVLHNGMVNAGETYRFEYKAPQYPQRMITYRLVSGGKITTGKIIQLR